MVRKLLKLTLPNIVVLQKNSHHNTEYLKRSRHFSGDSKNYFAIQPTDNTLTISKKKNQQILTRTKNSSYWKSYVN